eukprot:4785523-Pyramimonas_sp.AAC.1
MGSRAVAASTFIKSSTRAKTEIRASTILRPSSRRGTTSDGWDTAGLSSLISSSTSSSIRGRGWKARGNFETALDYT